MSMPGANLVVPPLPPGSSRGVQPPPVPPPPQLQPRNPKVSVPAISPGLVKSPDAEAFVKSRFVASSPMSPIGTGHSPQVNGLRGSLMRQTGVTPPKKKQRPSRPEVEAATRGQTPDWIREIFNHAKRGDGDKLVSHIIL